MSSDVGAILQLLRRATPPSPPSSSPKPGSLPGPPPSPPSPPGSRRAPGERLQTPGTSSWDPGSPTLTRGSVPPGGPQDQTHQAWVWPGPEEPSGASGSSLLRPTSLDVLRPRPAGPPLRGRGGACQAPRLPRLPQEASMPSPGPGTPPVRTLSLASSPQVCYRANPIFGLWARAKTWGYVALGMKLPKDQTLRKSRQIWQLS